MLSRDKLEKFAELAVRVGANMQKGQEVVLRCDVAVADFARVLAKKAYECGAKRVHMQWRDEKIARIHMDCAETETLCKVPDYQLAESDYFIKNRCCLISVAAGDPNIFKGCDPEKVAKVNAATGTAQRAFREATMSNLLRWTIVSVPTENWAKAVFPDAPPERAVDRLWESIAAVMRLNEPDPAAAWKEHIATLHRRADFLNAHRFSALRLTSKNGTDLTVGLADGHTWLAAEEVGQDGVPFTANMPTEEIFTAPHRAHVNGVVKNALPLSHNGTIIDDFSLTFRDGKVVDFSAGKGYEALAGIFDTDEGASRLGEVALIGKRSPISELGILFYNTLFDENASCHLAFGQAYPTTLEGGNGFSEKELEARGANRSVEHVDFMVGAKDLRVVGIAEDGTETELFSDGDWIV